MSWYDYLFSSSTTNSKWVSVLIIFSDENQTILDKGFIFPGEIPRHYFAYFCNFSNFTVIEQKLYYFYSNGIAKQIDPNKVFLHIKFGNAPYNVFDKTDMWNLFFSSSNSKIYGSIKDSLKDKVKLLNVENVTSNRLKVDNINHPLFKTKQIYGTSMDQVILSGLNIDLM